MSQVQQERRVTLAAFWTRLFIVVMVAYLLGSTAVITVLALQDHERIKQNREIQAVIRDCVQVGGHCYNQNLRARKQLTDDINRYSVLAAACAVVVPLDASTDVREKAIEACIRQQLEARP